MMQEKIRELAIILWDYEKRIIELQRQIQEKNNIIKELQATISWNELELTDLHNMLDMSSDTDIMNKMQYKIDELTKINKVLLENYMLYEITI